MTKKKVLSLFTLAMINVAAVASVRNWPLTAEYGLSSIFYLLLSALVFFVPVAIVSAELASGWPKAGGIFAWIKEAFGHRLGFLSVWLLWVENIFYYPTLLSFIAASIAYVFSPDLARNPIYMAITILSLFWIGTLSNLKGMKTSGWVSTLSVIFGTFLPGGLIILLGLIWYFNGFELQIAFTAKNLIPSSFSPNSLIFLTGVLLSFAGIEMSAVHVKDVENPQKTYPRAIFLSVLIIVGISLLGVLAIAMVIPKEQISLAAGSLQAFNHFLEAYGMKWAIPVIAFLLTLGAYGTLNTWIVGPCRGLLAAAQMGDLPPLLQRENKQGMPSSILIGQAILVTILSMLFLFLPSINSAFILLTGVATQFYLVMYIMMFVAAIKLRYTRAKTQRSYKIPFGNIGMWFVAGIGIIASLFTMYVGFIPPSDIEPKFRIFYVISVFFILALGCFIPSIILLFKKKSWERAA